MSVFKLILKEIVHRKFNFLLSVLAVTTAVAFLVSFYTTGEASKRETIRLMRDMGYNLRIVSQDTDMDHFYARGYSQKVIPQGYVKTIAQQEGLLYTHLLATIYKKFSWNGREAFLTGIAPEVSPVGKKKSSMIFTIAPGTVYVGYELVDSLKLSKGDSVEILGESFTVKECLAEQGSEDDIRVFAALSDVQRILDMDGKINEIQALNCYCAIPGVDPLDLLREQLATMLPDVKVIQKRAIAKARTRQRELMNDYFALIMPFVVIVCAVWIGALAMLNTRERRQEIGILRALGFSSGKIAWLFLGKSVLIGLVGAVAGFAAGTGLALLYGPDIFKVTAKTISPIYGLLVWSLIGAPAFAALSCFIPAATASTQDPADVLREE